MGSNALGDSGVVTLRVDSPVAATSEIKVALQPLQFSLYNYNTSVPLGGTAVGTGLNTHAQFGGKIASELAARTGCPFVTAPNKFAALAGHEALLFAHGALKTLAAALINLLEVQISETDRMLEVQKLAEALRLGDLAVTDIVHSSQCPSRDLMPDGVRRQTR